MPAIGIDLGTTFSVIACIKDGRPMVIPATEGGHLTASVVAVLKNGERLVGEPARMQAAFNPHGTAFSVKRRMGRRAYLPAFEGKGTVRGIKRLMGSDYTVKLHGHEYTPEEVSAIILKKLKRDAEFYLGSCVEKAVISVPAYFNATQRQATVDAAHIAGLDVLRLIDEPTAATLAYGLDVEGAQTVLVWDLGGGTFDVSILRLGDGVFEVKSVNGDTALGGDDFDDRIVEWMSEEFRSEYGINPKENASAMIRFKYAAERAKIELSSRSTARIRIPRSFIMDGGRGCWEILLTRKMFEEFTGDLFKKMVGPTMKAMEDAAIGPEQVDRAILVGGSTRMPLVGKLFKDIMGKEPFLDIPPDEAVALGAAVQAGILCGEIKEKLLIDVAALPLGIEAEGGAYAKLIEKNTALPVNASRIFTNARDGQDSMDIHVLQGERGIASSNTTLGRFALAGIAPSPRGGARVEVNFGMDHNGILNVTARDLHTDNSKMLRISPRFYGLPMDVVERMRKEAMDCAEKDSIDISHIQLRIMAADALKRACEILSERESHQIEAAVVAVEQSLSNGDYDALEKKVEWLKTAVKESCREG